MPKASSSAVSPSSSSFHPSSASLASPPGSEKPAAPAAFPVSTTPFVPAPRPSSSTTSAPFGELNHPRRGATSTSSTSASAGAGGTAWDADQSEEFALAGPGAGGHADDGTLGAEGGVRAGEGGPPTRGLESNRARHTRENEMARLRELALLDETDGSGPSPPRLPVAPLTSPSRPHKTRGRCKAHPSTRTHRLRPLLRVSHKPLPHHIPLLPPPRPH